MSFSVRFLATCFSLLTGFVFCASSLAQTIPDASEVRLERVAGGFTRPLYVTHAGDGSGRLFVVEQAGRIWIIQDGRILPEPFLDIGGWLPWEVHSSGFTERGLLGLAFHPQYAENGYFFLHYNDDRGDTVLARFRVSAEDANRADLLSAQIILTVVQPFANHQGGTVVFGPDGQLYLGLGDGGSAGDPWGHGQRPNTLLGTILRLEVGVGRSADYAIPPDNPFVGRADAAAEVWVYGLRNPWRFSFDRETGDLFIGDVGQNQWEEISLQPAGSGGGENYGWNAYEGFARYAGGLPFAETVAPIAVYPHRLGNSVTGGYVYRGESLPGLYGAYVFGDFGSGRIWTLQPTAAGNWWMNEFMRTTHAISSFGEDERGELYLLDYADGSLWQFVPR